MDGFIEKPKEKCPAEKANFVSKFFFLWMRKVFTTAARRDLEIEDLCYPLESDAAEGVSVKLERSWARELNKLKNLAYSPGTTGKKKVPGAGPNLCRAICVVFWWDYLKCGLKMFTMNVVLKTLQPFFQKEIIGYFGGSGAETMTPKSVALSYAGGLIGIILINVWLHHHTYLECYQVAMRARVACSSLVYGKVLRLSKSALNKTTPGQIVNLLSNDLSRFDIVGPLLHKLWILPMQVIVIGTCLYLTAGPIAFVGMGSLLLLIVPVQFFVIRSIKSLRRLVAGLSDQRIQLMGELINGIQVVKMYAWERTFAKVVSGARHSEMRAIRSANYLRAFTLAIAMFTDKVNLFATLVTYVLVGNELTAEVVFTVAMYYNILQAGSAFVFPSALLQTGEVAVSIRRLQNFLMLDEFVARESIEAGPGAATLTETQSSTLVPGSTETMSTIGEALSEEAEVAAGTEGAPTRDPVFLEMQRLSANWLEGQLPPTLCDVSLKIYGGELCALVGQVGSGKSSLLNVILRELPIGSGNVFIRQRIIAEFEELSQRRGYVTDNPSLVVSYACQEAWLVTGTVRDNILFGQPWEARKYQEVTRVCALWRDIRQWPDGDSTIVGDRGIALSGGQKARVNLARAVYKDADVYLLDDPLSAVDNRVGQHLFRKCINGYLKGKTRILVTHQLQYLKSVDTIVVLDRGLVRAQGTFQDLSKSNPDFMSLLSTLANSEKENEKKSSLTTETTMTNEAVGIEQLDMTRWASIASVDSLSVDWTDEGSVASGVTSQHSEISPRGKMSWEVWRRYFGTGGSTFVLMILVAMVLTAQLSLTITDLWLTYWSNLEAVRTSMTDPNGVTPAEYRSFVNNTVFSYFSMLNEDGLISTNSAIYVYSGLIACCVIFNLTRNMIFMAICVRISRKLHNRMFRKILRATMRFFNLNQSGRIVNRFSKDVGAMDELLPSALLDASRVILLMGGVFVTILVTNVWMVLPMMVLLPVFYWLTRQYLVAAYSIKRLEGICKSPIFTQVIATLQGLATIRSNGPGVARILRRQFNDYQDIHSGVWFLSAASSSAFSLWLDLFTCAFVACVCFTPILLDHENTFGGTVGLAISQSMLLTGLLQYGVKQCAETAIYMTAIERILQYTDVKSEESPTSGNPPPANWPTQGRLSMKNVFMSYTDDNLPVLKDLNLTFEPGWKVGVVGRTGAGKSSLISAIFRLENDGLQGEIKIDGRDTSSIGLDELRSRISIIPQESVLFSGTLRYNLDPFDRYDDAALWDALKEVELGDLSLELSVSESGSNFSVGQRQLICLARAILKNNRILVLDEATANIDARTDALIQKTLKTKFARHTVITVAHRLVTVIENDRILVMENGHVSEFGCPYELLCNNPDGPFAEMVRQAGPEVAENLIRLAEVACLEVPAQHSLDLNSSISDDSITSPLRKV